MATPAPSPAAADPSPYTGDLCWLLSRASHVLTTELTAALERLGISPRAHSVLGAAMTGHHTQIELARIVGLDKTTMVATLDELQAAGLAERRPSPSDRRARIIAVTEAGERAARDAQAIGDRVREDVLQRLAPDERRIFMDALRRLVSDRLSEPVACTHPVRRRASRG